MKKSILTSLLFLGLLVGCSKPSSSESETPSESASQVSSESVSETQSEIPSQSVSESEEEEDTEPLPSIPEDSGPVAGDGLANGTITIAGAIPAGWVYVSNNPTQFPNPEFYKSGVAGLKLAYPDMGLKSPTFAASAKTIVLAGNLNVNTRTGTKTTLAIYTISGSTETLVRSAVFSATGLKTYSESYSLPSGTTQFFIKLTANGGYNVDLSTITIS